MRYNMSITLEEAFSGKTATINVPGSVVCGSCTGTGSEGGKPPITCKTCNGRGTVRAQSGFFTIERTCPSCDGVGKTIEKPCRTCVGTGWISKERTLNINIPAGVEDGTRIRMTGEGSPGLRGGTPGDLYIFIDVKPHQIFEREESNLYCKVPISFVTAAIGGKIDVPTIDGGKARVTVPEGTQSGKQFRLRGKGMPVLRSKQYGDLYIEIHVETPVNLTKKQKELLEEFEKDAANNNPSNSSFFDKVKDFWGGMTGAAS
jgi:molecular chaperone DnaJ